MFQALTTAQARTLRLLLASGRRAVDAAGYHGDITDGQAYGLAADLNDAIGELTALLDGRRAFAGLAA